MLPQIYIYTQYRAPVRASNTETTLSRTSARSWVLSFFFFPQATFIHILQRQKIVLKGRYMPGENELAIQNPCHLSALSHDFPISRLCGSRLCSSRALYITKAISRNCRQLIAFYLARARVCANRGENIKRDPGVGARVRARIHIYSKWN